MDGQLQGHIRESNRRAIGLIKSVARPEFAGKDVGLCDLEPGMMTTSFVPDWQLRRDPGERRTSWVPADVAATARRGRSGLVEAGGGPPGYGAG